MSGVALLLPLQPHLQAVAVMRQRRERRGLKVLQLDVGVELVLERLAPASV